MYRFPLMLCLILFAASCAISKAELVGEVAPTVKNSDIIMKQIVSEERQNFDKKYTKIQEKKQKTIDKYQKIGPSVEEQVKNVKIEY